MSVTHTIEQKNKELTLVSKLRNSRVSLDTELLLFENCDGDLVIQVSKSSPNCSKSVVNTTVPKELIPLLKKAISDFG